MASPFLKDNPRYFQLGRQAALFIAILMSGGNLIFPRIPLLVLGFALLFLCRGPNLGLRREMWPIGALLLLVMAVVIGSGNANDAIVDLAVRYANFAMAIAYLGLYFTLPADTLAHDLRPILRLMSWQAILTVPAALLLPGLFVSIAVGETNYETLAGILTYHSLLAERGAFVRPDGFFFEPGVFQIYLNIFLFISLFVSRRIWDIGLAVCGVLATQSTVGVSIMSLLIGSAYLARFRTAGRSERVIALAVAPLLAGALLYVVGTNLVEKLTGATRGSAWAREYDFRTGVNMIREHPFVGVGLDPGRYREEARRLGYDGTPLSYADTAERSGSNGLVVLIASLGIPLALPFLIGMFRQRFFPRPLLFGTLLILGFTGEAIILTPFFLMLIFSAMLAGRRVSGHRAQAPWTPAHDDLKPRSV